MSKTKQIIAAILAILGIGGGLAYSQLGGSVPGLSANIASSAPAFSVKKDAARMLFATSTNCSARIITTQESAIRLTFGDEMATPTPTSGLSQAASTTVTYDAAIYGCGMMKVIGFDANADTSITVVETR